MIMMKQLKDLKSFVTFINELKLNIMKTIRDLAKEYPEMWNYNYKWRNTENPESEKMIDEVISEYGYKFKGLTLDEVDELVCEYNDLKGYLECEIELM